MPEVSVIVPVHNNNAQLAHCLSALRASKLTNFEIVVVDDSSSDGTWETVQRCGVRAFRTSQRMGPAVARNLGAQHALGSILVFVDSDVIVPPDALTLITERFKREPDVAAVFGSYDDAPWASAFVSQYKNLLHHYVHQNSKEDAATFWSGCGAIRRQVFEEVAGFAINEYGRPTIEDIELGYRLREAGYRVRLEKRLQVKHLKRWTMASMIRTDVLDRAIPWSKLILESQQMPRDLNLTYAARTSGVLVAALVAAAIGLLLACAGIGKGLLPGYEIGILATSGLLFTINHDVYRFFYRVRGVSFATRAVLMHWLYFFYSGLAWCFCYVQHLGKPFLRHAPALHVTPTSESVRSAPPDRPLTDRLSA